MSQQTLHDLLKRYAELKEAKKALADQVQTTNEMLGDQESRIISEMMDLAETTGIKDITKVSFEVGGRKYGLIQKPYYSIRAIHRDVAFQELRQVGLGDLIEEKVSDADLTKALNEIIAANDGVLPEGYSAIPIEVYEKTTISDRKAYR